MEYFLKVLSRCNDNKSVLISKLIAICPDAKLTNSHINNWIYRDKKVPSNWVLPLCAADEWQVTPHQLRPDIYPHPDDGLPPEMRCQCEDEAA